MQIQKIILFASNRLELLNLIDLLNLITRRCLESGYILINNIFRVYFFRMLLRRKILILQMISLIIYLITISKSNWNIWISGLTLKLLEKVFKFSNFASFLRSQYYIRLFFIFQYIFFHLLYLKVSLDFFLFFN